MLASWLSYFFSVVDFASVFIFIMAIFDIPIRRNWGRLMVSIIGCAVLSHLIIAIGWHSYALWILMPTVFLIFRYYFQESGLYSLWISLYGYVFPLLIQYLLVYGFLKFKLMTNEELVPFSTKGYMIQTLTFIIIIAVSIYTRRFGEQFSFNFGNIFGKKRRGDQSVKYYVIVAIFIFVLVSMFFPTHYGKSIDVLFYVNLMMTGICFAVLSTMSILRNRTEL